MKNPLRFGTKSLLILTLVFAVVIGLWVRKAKLQRAAIAKLSTSRVNFHFAQPAEWCKPLPKWIRFLDDGHLFHGIKLIDMSFNSSRVEVTTDQLQAIRSLRSLESVRISDGECDVDEIAKLMALPKLENLEVRSCKLVGKLHRIVKPQLLKLKLECQGQTEELLPVIAHARQLEELELNLPYTDHVASKVQNLKKLRILQFKKYYRPPQIVHDHSDGSREEELLTDEGIRLLQKLSKLEIFEISNTSSRLTADSLKYLGQLPALTRLTLPGDLHRNGGWEHLKQVRSLKLNGASMQGPSNWKGLSRMDSLRFISFGQGHVVDQELCQELKGVPKLLEVGIQDRYSLREIKGLLQVKPQLKFQSQFASSPATLLEAFSLPNSRPVSLYVVCCDDVEGQLANLANLSTLSELCLINSQIFDDDLSAVGKIPGLTTLMLSDLPITARGWEHLRDHPSLHTLLIGRSVQVNLPCLAEIRTLEKLVITDLDRLDDALVDIASLPYLVTLVINDCKLTKMQLAQVARSPSIRELRLIRCSLTVDALSALSDMKLEHLLILRMAISPEGLSDIAKIRSLKRLSHDFRHRIDVQSLPVGLKVGSIE